MEEVSAGVMGKIVGQRAFIRQLRAKGLLARTFDHIRNICGAIANRAFTKAQNVSQRKALNILKNPPTATTLS